jgi:hypothetical protein
MNNKAKMVRELSLDELEGVSGGYKSNEGTESTNVEDRRNERWTTFPDGSMTRTDPGGDGSRVEYNGETGEWDKVDPNRPTGESPDGGGAHPTDSGTPEEDDFTPAHVSPEQEAENQRVLDEYHRDPTGNMTSEEKEELRAANKEVSDLFQSQTTPPSDPE